MSYKADNLFAAAALALVLGLVLIAAVLGLILMVLVLRLVILVLVVLIGHFKTSWKGRIFA